MSPAARPSFQTSRKISRRRGAANASKRSTIIDLVQTKMKVNALAPGCGSPSLGTGALATTLVHDFRARECAFWREPYDHAF